MGRRKLHRKEQLFVRLTKENNAFLKKLCKARDVDKTTFIDNHLAWLRLNIDTKDIGKFLSSSDVK